MELHGASPVCERLWANGAMALLGISPFNSYFSTERIRELIAFCAQDGRSVALFVPDNVTRYTLQARGYSEQEALHKTRRQIRYLRNKMDAAMQPLKLPVLDGATLAGNAAYRDHHAAMQARFEADADFRRACLDTTRWVLSAKEGEPVTPAAAMLGVQYLLAELPLFFNAPEILATPKVVFIYHQCPSLIAKAFRSRVSSGISPGQGFAVVRAESSSAPVALAG